MNLLLEHEYDKDSKQNHVTFCMMAMFSIRSFNAKKENEKILLFEA